MISALIFGFLWWPSSSSSISSAPPRQEDPVFLYYVPSKKQVMSLIEKLEKKNTVQNHIIIFNILTRECKWVIDLKTELYSRWKAKSYFHIYHLTSGCLAAAWAAPAVSSSGLRRSRLPSKARQKTKQRRYWLLQNSEAQLYKMMAK